MSWKTEKKTQHPKIQTASPTPAVILNILPLPLQWGLFLLVGKDQEASMLQILR